MIFALKKKKNLCSRLFLFACISIIFVVTLLKQSIVTAKYAGTVQIDIVGDSIYLNKEKFLIKGVGYSPYRPDQWPGSPVSLDIIEEDFKRIKEAGFNTLRVWDVMSEEQLKLAEKYGLKVIQAVYLEPRADFSYSGYVRMAESKVRRMCIHSRNHPNVIMYLIMNEPHASAVISTGVDNTLKLYKRLIRIAKEEDPSRPVSMANAYWTLWLDQSMWDVVCFNAYSYCAPAEGIGFANFVEGLKSIHSKGRPFVVSEFGLSVSPRGSGRVGYGGNTEKEQAEGLITCLRGLVGKGAVGGCVFEWNDEWWKAGNPDVHDNHAEEWFGIVGIENRGHIYGTPRKAYYNLKDELKLIITQPEDGYRMLEQADIEINAPREVTNIKYSIDSGQWLGLVKTGDWWRGKIDGSNMEAGLHRLTVRGIDGGEEIIRSLNIIRCRDEEEINPPINLELTTDKQSYKNGEIIKILARLTDRKGLPMKDYCVKSGVLNSTNNYHRQWEGVTDANGNFSKTIPVIGNLSEWYYIYWAGAETEEYGYKKLEGRLNYVKADIGEGIPIKLLVAKRAEGIKIDGVMEDAWLNADKIEIDADTNFAEGAIDNPDDLRAEVRALWDASNIYILASVKDDIPMRNKHKARDLWNGDCIELFISVDPNKIPKSGYSSSDFQILIGTNGEMWIPGQAKGGVRNYTPVLSKAVAKKAKVGYILEARINIANFYDKPSRLFGKGDVLGFEVAIGDADASDAREGKIVWNGTADGYKDSAVWGRLRLE